MSQVDHAAVKKIREQDAEIEALKLAIKERDAEIVNLKRWVRALQAGVVAA